MYFELLEKKGNSNLPEQTDALEKVISQLENYKIVVLGDREFCVSLFSIMAQGEESILLFTSEKADATDMALQAISHAHQAE